MHDNNNYFANMIRRILDDGIYLGEIGSSKEYLEGIANYFNQSESILCKFDYKTLIIEDSMCDPILNLVVRNNTLYILPSVENNFFSCFIKILGYVSDQHKIEKRESKEKKVDENEFKWI